MKNRTSMSFVVFIFFGLIVGVVIGYLIGAKGPGRQSASVYNVSNPGVTASVTMNGGTTGGSVITNNGSSNIPDQYVWANGTCWWVSGGSNGSTWSPTPYTESGCPAIIQLHANQNLLIQATEDGGSANVSDTQERLQADGLYAGPINGNLDAATKTAIELFQKKNSIGSTGSLDVATLKALFGIPVMLRQ